MKTQQQELNREEELKENFSEQFNKYNLDDLYLIQETLEKEIRLSEIIIYDGYKNE